MPKFLGTFIRAIQGKPLFDSEQQNTGQAPVSSQPSNQNPYKSFEPNQAGQSFTQQPSISTPQPLSQPVTHEENTEAKINKGDYRTFPVVRVRDTNTHVNNGQMEIRSLIINDSPFHIDVDKVEIFEAAINIRYPLGPRQEKEFLIYRGPCMKEDEHQEMTIEYKTEEGDYFKSIHDIKFHINADRSFSVTDIILHPPIRDIFG